MEAPRAAKLGVSLDDALAGGKSVIPPGQQGAQQAPREGTTVWGDGDQCEWKVVSGYWVQTGVCYVRDTVNQNVTYLYVLNQPVTGWFKAVDSTPEVTQNGAYYVFMDRATNAWEACVPATCGDQTTHYVYYGNQWITYQQLQGVVSNLQARVAAEQQRVAQQLQQSQSQAVPQQVQQQGGGQSGLEKLYSNPLWQQIQASQDHMIKTWLAPNCNASYNGCR